MSIHSIALLNDNGTEYIPSPKGNSVISQLENYCLKTES